MAKPATTVVGASPVGTSDRDQPVSSENTTTGVYFPSSDLEASAGLARDALQGPFSHDGLPDQDAIRAQFDLGFATAEIQADRRAGRTGFEGLEQM